MNEMILDDYKESILLGKYILIFFSDLFRHTMFTYLITHT